MSKAKKSSTEEQVVYDFLARANRPYSVQNIVDALQKHGVKKTAVERSLASLVEKKTVSKKEYGKAKIFILCQSNLDLPDPAEVARLDEDLAARATQLERRSARVAHLKEEAAALHAQPSDADAAQKLTVLKDALERKKRKRVSLGDGSTLMTADDKLSLELAYYQIKAMWKKYRRIVTDIIGMVGEATGQKPSNLHDEMDIETDEAASVSPSDFPDISNPAKRPRTPAPASSPKIRRVAAV